MGCIQVFDSRKCGGTASRIICFLYSAQVLKIDHYKKVKLCVEEIWASISLPFCFSPISSQVPLLLVFVFASKFHGTVLHSHRQVLLPFQEAEAFLLDDIQAREEVSGINPKRFQL